MQKPTGLVLAGAVARGAYEAGALSVLLPFLESHNERPTILVGTSAGAINAAFLASRADQSADAATRELIELWQGIKRKEVFDYSLFALPALVGQELGLVQRLEVCWTPDLSGKLSTATSAIGPGSGATLLMAISMRWPSLRRPPGLAGALCLSKAEWQAGAASHDCLIGTTGRASTT